MQTVFAYRAVRLDGSTHRGTLDADTSAAARAALSARGLLTVELIDRGARREQRAPIGAGDLALGLRILADLLESGLSVGRALYVLEDLAPKAWRAALPPMRQSVREGVSLATALERAPIAIPPLVIGIAQAGEAGSGLAPAVRRAAELMEASADLRSSVRSALAYPAVVAVAGAGAIVVLMTVVLPRFAKILADLGQALPASTRLVLAAAEIAHRGILPAALTAIAVGVLFYMWTATARGRVAWHRCLLALPVIGPLRLAGATSRVARSLGALLDAGVPIVTALTLSARAAADAEMDRRLAAARDGIAGGEPLSHALEATHAATLTAVRLIRAGEESGRLVPMLEHAARIEQQHTDRVIHAAVRMLEPLLLLAFASVVALVAAALLQAIYSVRPAA